MIKIGCHLSVSKGFTYMGKEIIRLGGNVFQFFTRNPRGGNVKALDMEDVKGLEVLMKENKLGPLLAHAPYTLNMAAPKEETFDFAKIAFKGDLERLELLPCDLYNFHPGSFVSKDMEWGMNRIIEGLNEVVDESCTSTILFETMSGKGSEVGSRFEEIAYLLSNVRHPEKYGVCIDTCHLYEAGYDIKNDLDGVLKEFDEKIGLDRIKAVHLNDSKNPIGAHKDRHEQIGVGTLGLEGIINVVTHPSLKHLPFYLETPHEKVEGYGEEIELIKEMVENGKK